MSNEIQAPSRTGVTGLVFVGCLLIGLAIGIYIGNFAAAILAALGIGFIAMGLVRLVGGQW